MGTLTIYCCSCGEKFNYNIDDITERNTCRCPYCTRSMNMRQWGKLRDACLIFEEVNKGLRSSFEERGGALMQAEYKCRGGHTWKTDMS